MARRVGSAEVVGWGRVVRLQKRSPLRPGMWCLTLLLAACARAPDAVVPQPIESYQFQHAQDGVRVAVDPFFTLARTQATFRGGEDFAGSGLLPVHVVIENRSSGDIRVDPRDFRLVRRNGETEIALSAYEAFSKVRVGVGWWWLAGHVGASAPAAKNDARQKDIETHALQAKTIPPNGSASGFVYFALHEGENDLAGNRIVFLIQGPASEEMIHEIPIGGHRDRPTSAKQPEAVLTPAPSIPKDPQTRTPTRIEGAGGGVIIRSPSQ